MLFLVLIFCFIVGYLDYYFLRFFYFNILEGDHGYNNSLMDMHPFFIAHGPVFREGYVSEPFSSANVYELICHIMGVSLWFASCF